MADILSDLYPIPVVFTDGQQPTAKFLNAWAAQIDTAFAILGRILGDFDGESSEQGTFISNINRAMGSIGWINPRLPHNLKWGLTDMENNSPTLLEKIGDSWSDQKDAFLTFVPKSVATTLGDFDGNGIYADSIAGDDFARINASGANNTGGLSTAEKWAVAGRRIYTTTPIPATAIIKYEVDPTETETYDSYHSTSGANVIPSLYEIAEQSALPLCTYREEDVDNHFIDFPYILRCMNPLVPLATGADVVNLISDEMLGATNISVLKWADTASTPRYTIPEYIYTLAENNGDEANRIPDGLVSLWVHNGERIVRVVNQNSEDQIAFYIVPGSKTSVQVIVPEALVNEMPHQILGQETLSEKYIIAFAGISIAESIAHARAEAVHHHHDGTDSSNYIEFGSVVKRFKPSEYSHSIVDYNLTPQYFLRSGYEEGSDPLNRDNAILGDILLGASSALATNSASPNNAAATSHRLYFGSKAAGSPAIYFDSSDTGTAWAYGGDTGASGKLNIEGKILRVQNGIFLGEPGHVASIWLKSTSNNYLSIGNEDADNSSGTAVEAGKFVSFDKEIWFGQFAAGKVRHIPYAMAEGEGVFYDPFVPHREGSLFLFGDDDNNDSSVVRAGTLSAPVLEGAGVRRTFNHDEGDYGNYHNIYLFPATTEWVNPLVPSLLFNPSLGYGLVYGTTADSTPGRFFDPAKTESTFASFILPVPIQPSASASGLGESSQIIVVGGELRFENIDGSQGRFRVDLYKVDYATLVRTQIYTTGMRVEVPANEFWTLSLTSFESSHEVINPDSEFLEFEIELESRMGYLGGYISVVPSHIG